MQNGRNFFLPCVWLAADVQFARGHISGGDAPELWRGTIKNELGLHRPHQVGLLLEPMKHRVGAELGRGCNMDCPGLILESESLAGQPGEVMQPPAMRVHLKFLGSSMEHAVPALLALQSGLSKGVGKRGVVGTLTAWHARRDGGWLSIPIPMRASDLQPFADEPSALANGVGPIQAFRGGPPVRTIVVRTTSRWIWRKARQLVSTPPQLTDVLDLVEARVRRVVAVWGEPGRVGAAAEGWECPPGLQREAQGAALADCHWALRPRLQRNAYPSDGCEGHLSYVGHFSPALIELLQAGSFLHVGQQTAIGLGGYAVEIGAD